MENGEDSGVEFGLGAIKKLKYHVWLRLDKSGPTFQMKFSHRNFSIRKTKIPEKYPVVSFVQTIYNL